MSTVEKPNVLMLVRTTNSASGKRSYFTLQPSDSSRNLPGSLLSALQAIDPKASIRPLPVPGYAIEIDGQIPYDKLYSLVQGNIGPCRMIVDSRVQDGSSPQQNSQDPAGRFSRRHSSFRQDAAIPAHANLHYQHPRFTNSSTYPSSATFEPSAFSPGDIQGYGYSIGSSIRGTPSVNMMSSDMFASPAAHYYSTVDAATFASPMAHIHNAMSNYNIHSNHATPNINWPMQTTPHANLHLHDHPEAPQDLPFRPQSRGNWSEISLADVLRAATKQPVKVCSNFPAQRELVAIVENRINTGKAGAINEDDKAAEEECLNFVSEGFMARCGVDASLLQIQEPQFTQKTPKSVRVIIKFYLPGMNENNSWYVVCRQSASVDCDISLSDFYPRHLFSDAMIPSSLQDKLRTAKRWPVFQMTPNPTGASPLRLAATILHNYSLQTLRVYSSKNNSWENVLITDNSMGPPRRGTASPHGVNYVNITLLQRLGIPLEDRTPRRLAIRVMHPDIEDAQWVIDCQIAQGPFFVPFELNDLYSYSIHSYKPEEKYYSTKPAGKILWPTVFGKGGDAIDWEEHDPFREETIVPRSTFNIFVPNQERSASSNLRSIDITSPFSSTRSQTTPMFGEDESVPRNGAIQTEMSPEAQVAHITERPLTKAKYVPTESSPDFALYDRMEYDGADVFPEFPSPRPFYDPDAPHQRSAVSYELRPDFQLYDRMEDEGTELFDKIR